MKRIVIIGAGFGGLSAACYAAAAGYDTILYEKTSMPGGRAQVYKNNGYTFDLGPSWYLMPDIYEDFFTFFGKKPSDYYDLHQLTPSYRIYDNEGHMDITTKPDIYTIFDTLDPGSGARLATFLDKTAREYTKVRSGLLDLDGTSYLQFLNPKALSMLLRPELLKSYHNRIQKVTKNNRLQKLLEFMVVFMGGSPKNIPALYSLLSHVDLGMGVFYPMAKDGKSAGGFGLVAHSFETLAKQLGVKIKYNSTVTKINVENGQATEIIVDNKSIACDYIIANADYHHVETSLLEPKYRCYSQKFWDKKTLSPSGIIITLGIRKKLPLLHHDLFFDTVWEENFDDVYKNKKLSSSPLFYLCVPSQTDPHVAPPGHENLYILIPAANGLKPTDTELKQARNNALKRIENATGEAIEKYIVHEKIFAHEYFEEVLNAYKGNSFGLAHTLMQSGPLRAKMKSKKVKNLYFVGQYTTPGTGVPLVVQSGKNVVKKLQKDWQ